MTTCLDKAQLEIVAVHHLRALVYEHTHCPAIAPFNGRGNLSFRQNRRLAALRSTPMPKILNGETKLPEVEALVEGRT